MKKILIAITGGIGAGKSLVSYLFEKKGFEQISVFKDLNGIERVVGALGFHG